MLPSRLRRLSVKRAERQLASNLPRLRRLCDSKSLTPKLFKPSHHRVTYEGKQSIPDESLHSTDDPFEISSIARRFSYIVIAGSTKLNIGLKCWPRVKQGVLHEPHGIRRRVVVAD